MCFSLRQQAACPTYSIIGVFLVVTNMLKHIDLIICPCLLWRSFAINIGALCPMYRWGGEYNRGFGIEVKKLVSVTDLLYYQVLWLHKSSSSSVICFFVLRQTCYVQYPWYTTVLVSYNSETW